MTSELISLANKLEEKYARERHESITLTRETSQAELTSWARQNPTLAEELRRMLNEILGPRVPQNYGEMETLQEDQNQMQEKPQAHFKEIKELLAILADLLRDARAMIHNKMYCSMIKSDEDIIRSYISEEEYETLPYKLFTLSKRLIPSIAKDKNLQPLNFGEQVMGVINAILELYPPHNYTEKDIYI